jgi:uncharacterized protein YprB with RNaseH-like and TPR domain
MHAADERVRPAVARELSPAVRLSHLLAWMAERRFADLLATGLLKDVEEIVVGAYLAGHAGTSRPAAYHWLRYEDPDPVARLAEGVRRLRKTGARFDAEAVDKACTKAGF